MSSAGRHLFSDFEYDRRQSDDPRPPLARISLAKKGPGSGGGSGGGRVGTPDDHDSGGRGGGECDSSMTWGDELVRQIHHHGFAIVELPAETAATVARGMCGERGQVFIALARAHVFVLRFSWRKEEGKASLSIWGWTPLCFSN